MTRTGFFWDERCFWHSGGNYATVLPVGGLVQPMAAGGLAESPESKRRLKNLMDVTGLTADLAAQGAAPADRATLERIHPARYLDAFKALSDAGGGQIGPQAPFGPGSYDIAAMSAGLAVAAVAQVLDGALDNAYALSRPPGHHCLPDKPGGFCLLANIPIAIAAAQARHPGLRVAVVDWDVHHGNGTEAIYYGRNDVLTISLHQEGGYPWGQGQIDQRGEGAGAGYNMNLPLPAGAGHATYLAALDRIVLPALARFRPDLIVVACGFDAAAFDPLSRTLATADTFRQMTLRLKSAAADLCGGKLVLVHEGGYSEFYVPFCGHATIAALAGSAVEAPDPLAEVLEMRQPSARLAAFHLDLIDDMAKVFT